MKKKIDARVRTLIENGVLLRHRSLFVIIGDRGKDQVVNLHYMLAKAVVKARPSVLWCYKKELGFTSHRKKRMKQIQKKMKVKGEDAEEDPFELFISSTNIRYCYYKESHKILGNTFGMCVLQDFEALTPNLLARTVETVEGGGLVVLLLRSMKSLQQFYTMAMDIHDRLRTESHSEVTPRFNERFLLSLASCASCLVLDDELNILPISSHIREIAPLEHKTPEPTAAEKELKELKESMKDAEPAGSLVACARTRDQAKAILMFIDAISEKTLRSTVTLTAARGRGKSAALGVAIAAAVAYGYSNVFVTSPTPENLKTLFELVFKGFDALSYKEHLDYDLVQSTNPEFNGAIVRVNIYHSHRQTIQYIHPSDSGKLGQAELVVIDEAAAIPLVHVRKLLGPYLVFMASTINGYEGTGRSLSLKLIEQLRQQQRITGAGTSTGSAGGRVLREITLEDPIRYAAGDPVERWLNELLCLDASIVPKIPTGCPSPDKCELFYVSKDTLFSYHKASESFLQRMMALYVSSHYKNTPNDLMLMSDAPGHHLFVLLGPTDPDTAALPDILCVVQVSLEGGIAKESVLAALSKGEQAAGDLIPWTISQQFQDPAFGSLSGGRIVRIATHPDYQKMGYGSAALKQLAAYYQGDVVDLSEDTPAIPVPSKKGAATAADSLLTQSIAPRKDLPPLLLKLSERKPERLHYLGVSYGITEPLLKFWKRAGYTPVYIRQTQNEITGEYTCIMFRTLRSDDLELLTSAEWLQQFSDDFKRRFISLLSFEFRNLPVGLSLYILDPKIRDSDAPAADPENPLTKQEMDAQFTPFDIKRLESYSKNLVDYHVILDLVPVLARFYFLTRVPVSLSSFQAAILLAIGLQHKSVDDISSEFTVPVNQVLAFFNKTMRKFVSYLRGLQTAEAEASLPKGEAPRMEPLKETMDEELGADAERLVKSLASPGFAVLPQGADDDWKAALKSNPSSVSLKAMDKNLKRKPEDAAGAAKQKGKEHRPGDHHQHKSRPQEKKH